MKILHTADVHLKAFQDERWKALEHLIERGKSEGIGLFAISGDLFDKDVDAENLRHKIRALFSGTGYPIAIIPGNHDAESFPPDLYFGADVVLFTGLDKPLELDEVRIFGLPFEPLEGMDLLAKLHAARPRFTDDKKNILLYHGELLDAVFARGDFGEEGENRYMPAKLAYFKDLNLDYVLAGHFHSRFDIRVIEPGRFFVYPGSPVSITRKETGLRKANLFEVGKPPQEHPLDTPHFETVNVLLDPADPSPPADRVESRLGSLHPLARAVLHVGGFVNGDLLEKGETEIAREIEEGVAGRNVELLPLAFRDIRRILEDDLFKRFDAKLEEVSLDAEKKKRVRDLAIQAMMTALT
ncbi:MAG: metallophosphoesterase family protein [Planctomycetota bacterium]|jgi:DNA repair exonuclease SbcCD nuclease subunit